MLKKIISIGITQVGGLLTNALRGKLFAVLLGPSGFGIVATIDQLVTSSGQFFNLGIPFTALKDLSRAHSLSEEEFRKAYQTLLQAIIVLAGFATVAALALVPWVVRHTDLELAANEGVIVVALLGLPATLLLMFFVNVLAARQDTNWSVLLSALNGLVTLVFGGIGCFFWGIQGIYWLGVPAATIFIIGAMYAWHQRMKFPPRAASTNRWKDFLGNRQLVRTAASRYVAVASASVMLLTARYTAMSFVGTEGAGFLQACLAVALSIGAVLGPANTLYFAPYVNRALPAAEKIAAAGRFLPQLIFLYCLAALPALLFPELVMRVLFSAKFLSAAPLLSWFIAWQCLYQISQVYQQLLIGLDDVRGYGVVTVLGNAIGIAVAFALARPFGLLGIALGFIGGAVATAVATAWRLRASHPLSAARDAVALLLFALVAFPMTAAVVRSQAELTWAGAGVRLALGGGFVVVLWFLLPKTLQTEWFSDVVKKLRGWKEPGN